MAIPKLFQWLIGVTAFLSVWLAFVTERVPVDVPLPCMEVIHVLPIYLLITFACYSLATVGYRVVTFNDCVEASEELKEEVEQAKADLRKKGYKFASDWS